MGRVNEAAAGFADRTPRALVLRPGSRVENWLERVAHEGRPFLSLAGKGALTRAALFFFA